MKTLKKQKGEVIYTVELTERELTILRSAVGAFNFDVSEKDYGIEKSEISSLYSDLGIAMRLLV